MNGKCAPEVTQMDFRIYKKKFVDFFTPESAGIQPLGKSL